MAALSRDTYEGPRGPLSKTEDSEDDIDIGSLLEIDSTKKKGWDDKQKLIEICQKEVGTISSGKRPLNIAIIGSHGCGKSSLLNTIFASFSDEKWKELAAHGSYGGLGKQISQNLISFKKEKYYFRKGPNNEEDDEILMPTFIDMKGFEDQNDEFTRELLNIIFYGRMQEFEKLSDVLTHYQNYGLNGLKTRYSQSKEYLVIDRIIFVCSGDPLTTLPTQLMACVSEVAHGLRGIPIYGVMTKADKFNGRNNPEVEKRETEFRKHLGIPNNRFVRIKNYCEDIDKEMAYMFSVIPQIDVRVLKLMTQVFSNALEVTKPEARLDYFSTEPNIQNESKEGANPVPPGIRQSARPVPPIGCQQPASSGIGFSGLLLLITIQVLFMAILLHFGMKPVITEEKLNTICANYDFIKSKHDATIDGLNELCDQKVDILKPPIYLLGGGIVFIIVVLPIVLYSFLVKNRN
ncbi:uncharacterized protein LOC127702638 isoform X3 [Mytilus californianus]|uniref:uncharacterized protein LOC127702638 isoform X3 n=1 Tax=Mytilus californianus TaxID=6549 RepID=UPI00224708F4|nr:uncharacterized protein LOC127702638 isoform X3 [Mytilus californianus]